MPDRDIDIEFNPRTLETLIAAGVENIDSGNAETIRAIEDKLKELVKKHQEAKVPSLICRVKEAFDAGMAYALATHQNDKSVDGVLYPFHGTDNNGSQLGWLLYVLRDMERMEKVGAVITFRSKADVE